MDLMKKVGWFLGLSGLIMFLFGLWLFITPTASVESIVIVLGLVLFISGLLKLFEALFIVKGAKMSGTLTIGGLVSFCVGLLILAAPSAVTLGVVMTFGVLAFLLALLALVSGIGHIAHGLKSKKNKWLTIGSGVILVLLAIFMLFHPLAAGIGLIMAIGIFFVFYGALLVALALNLKKLCAK